MSFYDIYRKYRDFNFSDFEKKVTDEQVLQAIAKETPDEKDFLALLSGAAAKHFEKIAGKAQKVTCQNFGKVIFLFTPLYLSNYCVNGCIYCSFNHGNDIFRKRLEMDEVEREAQIISRTGLKHILILTGESRSHSPVSYIKECVKVLRKYFSSISIEVYPLSTEEYGELADSGVYGLTLFQEVYDEEIYKTVHLSGPKKIYLNRLDAPERACMAGIRSVNIGTLLGLNDWRSETFFTGMHLDYLQRKYPEIELSTSLPRLRPHVGSFTWKFEVTDRNFVQAMLALRLFLPRIGITISTRERMEMRDNLLGLGVTKMSAGVSTEVGGHLQDEKTEGQFEISDSRTVDEMKEMLYKKDYQPVLKDWQYIM